LQLNAFQEGIPNGIDKEPPVTIWSETKTKGREATPSWMWNFSNGPVSDTRWSNLYLTANEKSVRHKPGAGGESGIRSYVYPAGAEIVDNLGFAVPPAPIGSLTYRSAPVQKDTMVIGQPLLTLYFSSKQKDTDFMVALHDVSPDGRVEYLQQGFLRASLREIDPKRSTPHNPVHPYDKSQYLILHKVYKVEIQFNPVGCVQRKGHRLELAIMVPPTVPLPHWGVGITMLPGVNTICQTAEYPPRLELPVIPGYRAEAPAPRYGSMVSQPCREEIRGLGNEARELDHVFQALKERQS
jgi:uncharacterized protein